MSAWTASETGGNGDVQALQDKGIQVLKYNPNKEGDRERAQMKATEREDVI